MATNIEILTAHRNRLARAANWEEYRDAHMLYVDYLIADLEAKNMVKEVGDKFVDESFLLKEMRDKMAEE